MDPIEPESDEKKAKQEENEQMRRDLLAAVLETPARERLSRIALVSPERSKEIEAILLRTAHNDQLRGRISDQQLLDLLDRVEMAETSTRRNTEAKKPSIVYLRTRLDELDDFDI